MRILFVTANRLGDAVMSTGLLDYLIRTWPTAHITVACGPVAEGLFQRMPNLERIVVMTKRPLGCHWVPMWRLAVIRWWDLVVDIRGSALSWLIPTKRRAVMRPASGHQSTQLAQLFQLEPAPLPVVWYDAQDTSVVARFLPADRPIIALGPTANWAPKVWPAAHFAKLFQIVASSYLPGAIPAIIAGPGKTEGAMAQPLLEALPNAIDLVGHLTLPEIASFLAQSALFVGNDSGLMHLAAASGATTIGLFGPTSIKKYAPTGRQTAALVGTAATMESISVDAVVRAIERLLLS